eukprot:m51a1_g1712 hypothetical protein (756) ;mRNA; r:538578-540845
MDTVPVEAVCYPCKAAHGHVVELAERGVPLVFMPCVPEYPLVRKRDAAERQYNCALVNGYADVIRIGVDAEKRFPGLRFLSPALPLHHEADLARRLRESMLPLFPDIVVTECRRAVAAGMDALRRYYADVEAKGAEVLALARERSLRVAVLACRPYHLDPALTGVIPPMLTAAGYCVLTAQSVCQLGSWDDVPHEFGYKYDNQIVAAAKWASRQPRVAFVHLLSFGCSISPEADDYVREAMAQTAHPCATVKLDQNASAGAIRVRVRSLLAAMDSPAAATEPAGRPAILEAFRESVLRLEVFTSVKQMRRPPCKALIFNFSPEHTDLWCRGFNTAGYDCRPCPAEGIPTREAAELGLRYTHPDLCYGVVVVLGRFIWALRHGLFDPDSTDLLWMHIGGACTAQWFAWAIKRAMLECGMPQVRVFSLDFGGGSNPGLSVGATVRLNMGLAFGEILQKALRRVRPYELVAGSADALAAECHAIAARHTESGSPLRFKSVAARIVRMFEELPLRTEARDKPLVGLVGYMGKADPELYRAIIRQLEEEEGCEVAVFTFMFHALTPAVNALADRKYISTTVGRRVAELANRSAIALFRDPAMELLRRSPRFSCTAPADVNELHRKVCEFLSPAHQAGEGWAVLAEMLQLLEGGVNNILSLLSFGCMPAHIGGRAVSNLVRARYPQANICVLDIDAGSSYLNHANRIRLMLESAKRSQTKGPGVAGLSPKASCTAQDLEDIGASHCAGCQVSASCSAQPPK